MACDVSPVAMFFVNCCILHMYRCILSRNSYIEETNMVLTRRNDCDHRFCPHLPFAYSSRLDGLKHGHESWPDSEKKDLGEKKLVLCKRLNICTKANSNTKKKKLRLDITVNIM